VYTTPKGPVSHAQRRLITLIGERRISAVLVNNWGVPGNKIGYLYRMALGTKPVSYGAVFLLRRYIPPVSWYYDEEESPPDPVLFTAKYPPFGNEIHEKILHDETAAIGIIRGIKEKRELSRFCTLHKVKYYDVAGCSFKNLKKDGREGYHQRPSYRMIRLLREAVHPDLWYIFPDELTAHPDKSPPESSYSGFS
jgi:hypothetical protein